MKLRKLKNIKKNVVALAFSVAVVVTSLPVVTTTTAVVIMGVSNTTLALTPDEKVRKAYYAKAARLRERAKKARANGKNDKADRLEEKADKLEKDAP